MGRLHDLHSQQGQSPWLDNLRRGWIRSGELERWVEKGVRGITSNPSIFQKAIAGSADYDEQFGDLVSGGIAVEDAYWDLVVDDIVDALRILAPIHDADPQDGYVSVEVDPELAHDTAGSEAMARLLAQRIEAPNLLVKIPGTAAGVPAIRTMISEGISINVTLLFSLASYEAVAEAYLSGLEAAAEAGRDLAPIRSVASVFVSRIDAEVDRRLDELGTPEALALKGRAAIANAQLAYQRFEQLFSGPRWEALAARGALPQRPLWASTSTKDPSYPDTLYVDTLIGPHTVNTLPDATIEAFIDHGTVARTVDADPGAAQDTCDRLAELGIDLTEVGQQLEDEGVAAFSKSFGELLDTLTTKADQIT